MAGLPMFLAKDAIFAVRAGVTFTATLRRRRANRISAPSDQTAE
jgi:hypothetical protein